MSNINFIVKDREVSGGLGRITIGLPASTQDMLTNDELRKILHTLKYSHYLDANAQAGFDYTLDFALEGRETFPYALDIELQE